MLFQISINANAGIFLSVFLIPSLLLKWYKIKAKMEVLLI